jgi:hypothetical protein
LVYAYERNLRIDKANRWWDKKTHTNTRGFASTQDFAGSLRSTGDKLIIIDFLSPFCCGSRDLHPKVEIIMQIMLLPFMQERTMEAI